MQNGGKHPSEIACRVQQKREGAWKSKQELNTRENLERTMCGPQHARQDGEDPTWIHTGSNTQDSAWNPIMDNTGRFTH